MDGLNVYTVKYEDCTSDKNTVDVISVYHMLHFVVSGKGEFNSETVSAGKAFLCRKHKHCRYTPSSDEPWSYYWINADGVIADKLLSECGFDSDDVIDFELTPTLSKLLKVGNMGSGSDFLCGIFIAIMGLLKHSKSERVLSVSERHVRDALDAINTAEGIITPSELAKRLCLSRAYLRNLFVKYKNEPPQEYIIRYRMTRAAELRRRRKFCR